MHNTDSDCAAARRRTRALERRYRRTKLPDDRLAWTKQVRDLHRLMLLSRTHFGKQRSRTVIQIQKNFGRHYHVYSAKINPERQSRPTVRLMLRISSRLSRLRWNLSGHQRRRHRIRSSRVTDVLPFSTNSLTLTLMKL